MLLERAGGRVAEGWHPGDTQTGTENSAWSQGLPKSPSVLSLPGPAKVPSLHTPPGVEGHPHRGCPVTDSSWPLHVEIL